MESVLKWQAIPDMPQFRAYVQRVLDYLKELKLDQLPRNESLYYENISFPCLVRAEIQVLQMEVGGVAARVANVRIVDMLPSDLIRLQSSLQTSPVPTTPLPAQVKSTSLIQSLEAINANLLVLAWAATTTGLLSQDKYEEKLKEFLALIAQERIQNPESLGTVFDAHRKSLQDKSATNQGDK